MIDLANLNPHQRMVLLDVILHVSGVRSLEGNIDHTVDQPNPESQLFITADPSMHRVCVVNRTRSFTYRDIRLWTNMSRDANILEERFMALKAIIDDTHLPHVDALRGLLPIVWTVINLVCLKVKVVSQHKQDTTSVQMLWRSSVHGRGRLTQVVRAPHFEIDHGCVTMYVLHPSFSSVLTHAIMRDRVAVVNSLAPLGVHFDYLEDPRIIGINMVFDMFSMTDGPSGLLSPRTEERLRASSDDVTCCVCLVAAPLSQITFVDECGHSFCNGCAAICSQFHMTHASSTTTNMPCPAEGCPVFLRKDELYQLVTPEDFETLTFNEVKVSLGDRLVECPKCSTAFERDEVAMQMELHKVETHFETNEGLLVDGIVLDKVLAMDRARYRFRCATCNAEFCSSCGGSPYHLGHVCRDPSEQQLTCRFCHSIISFHSAGIMNNAAVNGSAPGTYPNVCKDDECLMRAKIACNRTLSCGHRCGGVAMEPCIPCLDPKCVERRAAASPSASVSRQTNEDFCIICYIETLDAAPCVQLHCGHVFHFYCLESRLEKRWPTARITFRFMTCLICNAFMECEALNKLLTPLKALKAEVEKRSLERMRMDGKLQSDAITSPTSRHYNNPLSYASENYSYYLCSKCNKPFFGGMRRCGDGAQDNEGALVGDRDNIICGGCASSAGSCPKHGTQYIEYKCKYCCSLAVWFCWGTTHFCDTCHNPPRKSAKYACEGPGKCPLGGTHAPNGTECSLGCAMCRIETTCAST
eukprot:PhM_4_TR14404/c0_g1_i1/m.20587/K10693/MYCBP2, PAM; E3 ubiquitin-protein ligase MYCBP2